MRQRCLSPKGKDFASYGGRGITICKRWESFKNFTDDMGLRPTPQHTVERRNNNLGYRPSNCFWADRKEQGRNRRTVKLDQKRVASIRKHLLKGFLQQVIADKFKVSNQLISAINRGHVWD